MPDLSASLNAPQSGTATAAGNGFFPGMRAPSDVTGDGNSFASVLKQQAEKVGKQASPPAESAGKARDGKESAANPAASANGDPSSAEASGGSGRANGNEKRATAADEQAGDDAEIAGEPANATPMASILAQLMPAASTDTATDAGQFAGKAGTVGAMVREMARQHGRDDGSPATNKGLALGKADEDTNPPVQGAAGAGAPVAADAVAVQADAAALPLATTAGTRPDETAGALPDLVESTEAAADGAGAGKGTDFNALLTQARENQAAPPVSANRTHGTGDAAVSMRTPVGHPNWNNELGDKLTWMVTQQRQQAELVLNPPQLGRIEVSLNVSGDQASAVFASPNAAVREMLENSLPRLREILAGSGLNLGQADVGTQSFAQQQASGHEANRAGTRTDGIAPTLPHAESGGQLALGRVGERRGMVDIFA